MARSKARKATPKSRKINLSKTKEAAIKRVVVRTLNDDRIQASAVEVIEEVAGEAMYLASEEDDPDYRAYAEAAVRTALEIVLPILAKKVVTRDFIRSYIAGFDYVG